MSTIHRFRTPLLAIPVLIAWTLVAPITVAAQVAPATQTITIHDTRSGDGPCGFLVERTIEGTVAVVPSIDAAGNLVLAIEPVTLHGTLSNPATGKSVDLRWIRPNGVLGFGQDGGTMTVAWLLDGHFFRGKRQRAHRPDDEPAGRWGRASRLRGGPALGRPVEPRLRPPGLATLAATPLGGTPAP
jgi:hypothetical protein